VDAGSSANVGQRLFSFNKEDFTMSNIGKMMNEVAKYAKPFEQAADAMETLGAMKALVLLAKGDLKGAIAAFKEGASAAKAIMDFAKEALFPGLQMKPQSMSCNNQAMKADQASIASTATPVSKDSNGSAAEIKPSGAPVPSQGNASSSAVMHGPVAPKSNTSSAEMGSIKGADVAQKSSLGSIEGDLDDLINTATAVKKMLGAFKKHAMDQMPKSPLEALLTTALGIPSKPGNLGAPLSAQKASAAPSAPAEGVTVSAAPSAPKGLPAPKVSAAPTASAEGVTVSTAPVAPKGPPAPKGNVAPIAPPEGSSAVITPKAPEPVSA
jgi:hypothetical protein